MSIRNLIILSQLNPPAQRSRVLYRERVDRRLERSLNYPLTLIEAGTGYGKSTAILSFLNKRDLPVYWFTISGTDRDPQLFLAKLFTAFNQQGEAIGDEALRLLDTPDTTHKEALIAFINAISTAIHEDSLFILDDFHRVSDVPEVMGYIDWLIENLSPQLHLMIATRHSLKFSSINKWRVKGGVLEINKDDLTFTDGEIRQLFIRHYDIDLPDETILKLQHKTEGWAIGLQMVWQTLQSNPELSIQQVLEDERQNRTALFDYLAEEVLLGVEPKIQQFLLHTSILSKLDTSTCDFLLTANDSEEILDHLNNSGLFIEELRPGVYRYHQIFREFLLNRLQRDPNLAIDLHRKIGSYFRAHEYWEETIYHLLSAGDYHLVNQILESIGEQMIRDGRQESINYWVHEIPEDLRKAYPYIDFLLGEVNRFLGHFEEALEHYHTAERLYRKRNNRWGISMALRGQGQVFLDTIRPNNADPLLQDALKLLDPLEMPQEVGDLLVLTAENQLNLGNPNSAEALLARAKELRPSLDRETDLIQARIFLRTGRLQEGIDLLHNREASTPKLPPSRPQRFHRESTLLLSLFYTIMGDVDQAERYARLGIEIGKLFQSTFVQSVGYMRLGHALLLRHSHPFNQDGFKRAMAFFTESIEKVDVTRIHVEPLWGMCRALGYSGDLERAYKSASESLEIAQKAGDEWISILIQISLGASAVMAGDFEKAQNYLTTAETSSIKVKDLFTLSVSRLWLALKAWRQGFHNTAFGYLEKTLHLVYEHGYEFLLTQETYLGLKDREIIYPLLMGAFESGVKKERIVRLLDLRGLESGYYHPGYTLWVSTFGNFRTWRGDDLIDPQSWKREKAHQFFQLLVAHRDKWLHRDQIIGMLWADNPVENATNYLKVVFNCLNQALEPKRPKGDPPFFIERKQDSYRLNPKARIVVDADLFSEAIKENSISELEAAIRLYQGRYFAECYVQEWLVIEEQYYHQKFLMAAENLINQLIDQEHYEKALNVSYEIMLKDNLWEPAYRAQMALFHKMGKHAMVRKVFNQCKEVLLDQLGVEASPTTIELYQNLMAGTHN